MREVIPHLDQWITVREVVHRPDRWMPVGQVIHHPDRWVTVREAMHHHDQRRESYSLQSGTNDQIRYALYKQTGRMHQHDSSLSSAVEEIYQPIHWLRLD